MWWSGGFLDSKMCFDYYTKYLLTAALKLAPFILCYITFKNWLWHISNLAHTHTGWNRILHCVCILYLLNSILLWITWGKSRQPTFGNLWTMRKTILIKCMFQISLFWIFNRFSFWSICFFKEWYKSIHSLFIVDKYSLILLWTLEEMSLECEIRLDQRFEFLVETDFTSKSMYCVDMR